jgi:hypothetical protein
MLYDPRWEQVTAEPWSLESITTWLESQPADKVYDMCDTDRCLAGQYAKAMGFVPPCQLSGHIAFIAFGGLDETTTFTTFGGALSRARELATPRE